MLADISYTFRVTKLRLIDTDATAIKIQGKLRRFDQRPFVGKLVGY